MFINNLQGEFGGEFITDGETSSAGEVFQCAVCITETVVAGITMPGFTGEAALLTTLAAGTVIYGQISSMEVTTGIVQLFKQHTQGVN